MTVNNSIGDSLEDPIDISAIVCTWNRSSVLAAALRSIGAQVPSAFKYEIIVVDNNSTDDTARVVECFAASSPRIRYVFEPRQGISYARNAGIAEAKAPLLAFFDDDIMVASDWLLTILNVFERNRDVDYVGGKVLPRWPTEPPAWLDPQNWAPIAAQDHGDTALRIGPDGGPGLISANLAIRRSALDEVGSFRPELQRVRDGIGSMEDQELLERMQRAGKAGLYIPSLLVWADVPERRMTRSYHRRWHRGHGQFYAISRSSSFERTKTGRLFDVPAHLYRQAAIDMVTWLWRLLRRDPAGAFAAESRLWFFLGFLRHRWSQAASGGTFVGEVASFFASQSRRKAARDRRTTLNR